VLVIFLDKNFKVKVSQSVGQIFAVNISASPERTKGFEKGICEKQQKKVIFSTCSSKMGCQNVHD
jgi:hypothetical protein